MKGHCGIKENEKIDEAARTTPEEREQQYKSMYREITNIFASEIKHQ